MSQGKESFADRFVRALKTIGAKIKSGCLFVIGKIKGLFKKKKEEPTVIIDPATGQARPIAREMTRRQYVWREMKKNKVAYMMVGPFMILFFIFTVLPVFLSFILSLTDFNMLQMPHFKGLSNFQRLILDDEIFLLACKNTLIFASITGPVSYIMALLIAWFINELPPKIRAVVTLIFYAPSISGSVYLVWQTLFHSDSYGWANAILLKTGVIAKPILWFEDEKYVMWLCIVVALWTSLGTAFLSFIAGLQTIDRSLYEAAAVDGIRNRWQELWFITLPYMRPQLLLSAILAITGAFGFGGVITALVGFPSPNYCAWTIMHHLEDYG